MFVCVNIQWVWFDLFYLCSVHHGRRAPGLPLWSQLLPGQVLLWGIWHLLCWRVSDRLGLHAGYRRGHAHRLLALFCQICTEGAAIPHPFTHALIVLDALCPFLLVPSDLGKETLAGLQAMLLRKVQTQIHTVFLHLLRDNLTLTGMFDVLI